MAAKKSSTKKKNVVISTAPEKEVIIETVNRQIKNKKPVISSRFDEPVDTNRPVNIYVELVKGKLVQWCTTEDGSEEGREPIIEYNSLTQKKNIQGYNYFEFFTKANIEKLLSRGFHKTQVLFKDGNRREQLTPEQILSKLK